MSATGGIEENEGVHDDVRHSAIMMVVDPMTVTVEAIRQAIGQ